MMKTLHDPAVRDALCARVDRLTPESTRRWGTMTVDQMLWHVNEMFENSLNHFRPKDLRIPLPKAVIRFMVLRLPWPRGSPTLPEVRPNLGRQYPFEEERRRLRRLIAEFTARDMNSEGWGHSAGMGDINGRDWSALQAKHLDHHLRQFGV